MRYRFTAPLVSKRFFSVGVSFFGSFNFSKFLMGNSLLSKEPTAEELEKNPKLPMIYSPEYNIGFLKLETLHPFDSRKYEKIYNGLIESKLVKSYQFIKSFECTDDTLKLVHTKQYLNTLNSSSKVASYVEVPPLAIIPNYFIQRKLLTPMKFMTQGSILASEQALKYGWGLNLGGGFHHASADNGGGFCIYADISLIICSLMKNNKYNITKFMIIDLDAHQGNGHGTDKASGLFSKFGASVYIYDYFNSYIYPRDIKAKKGIDYKGELSPGVMDNEYLKSIDKTLENEIIDFDPQLIIYNAGTDILENDPLGNMNISEQGIIKRDEHVFSLAFKYNIPIVMLLSGGYQESNASVITRSILNLNKKFKLFNQRFKLKNENLDDEKEQKEEKEEKQQKEKDKQNEENNNNILSNDKNNLINNKIENDKNDKQNINEKENISQKNDKSDET